MKSIAAALMWALFIGIGSVALVVKLVSVGIAAGLVSIGASTLP